MGKSIFTCKICKEKYSSLEGLYSHLEEEHSTQIPPDMSVEQFYYFLKTGKEHGNCVMCKRVTQWNEKTKKYHRFCEDPNCKVKYKEIVDGRMIGKYGKVNLLNDPEQQRKMLMNRSIAGTYDFDGVQKQYVGSYELDFLKTMDLFFNWDPQDILMPSPHTYYYKYNGEEKFYIPDAFILSLGLEIEIKDGGDNPNMHHKIQDVDKEKERLKDEVMSTQKLHHYIKLTNKNYYNLFEFFKISKEYVEKYGDYEKIPKIIITDDIGSKKVSSSSKSLMKKEVDTALNESYVEEAFEPDKMLVWLDKPIDKLLNRDVTLYHGRANKMPGKTMTLHSVNVGATKVSKPRWSRYYWDNKEYAIKWAIADILDNNDFRVFFIGQDEKIPILNENMSDDEFIQKICDLNLECYVYEVKVPAKELEIGSSPVIKEYTLSKEFTYSRYNKIKLTSSLLKKYCKIYHNYEKELKSKVKSFRNETRSRGPILNHILDDHRDQSRSIINYDVRDENGNPNYNMDISKYRKEINYMSKAKKREAVNESYVCFPLLNGIISSQYKDIKSKDQYRNDVDGFKKHFLQGIDLVKTPDDALAMKTDLETMNKYLHDIKYSNKHSTFKNTQAVNEIENWINKVALPTLEKKTKKLTPVTEYNHYITFSLNNKMNRGLYGFIDNKSSIIFDDKVQIKRKNNIVTILTEGLELESDVTNITFGFNEDIDINITGNKTQGAYLRWNKDDDINTLIENVSKEWFNSKLKIENLHRIEGDDN